MKNINDSCYGNGRNPNIHTEEFGKSYSSVCKSDKDTTANLHDLLVGALKIKVVHPSYLPWLPPVGAIVGD